LAPETDGGTNSKKKKDKDLDKDQIIFRDYINSIEKEVPKTGPPTLVGVIENDAYLEELDALLEDDSDADTENTDDSSDSGTESDEDVPHEVVGKEDLSDEAFEAQEKKRKAEENDDPGNLFLDDRDDALLSLGISGASINMQTIIVKDLRDAVRKACLACIVSAGKTVNDVYTGKLFLDGSECKDQVKWKAMYSVAEKLEREHNLLFSKLDLESYPVESKGGPPLFVELTLRDGIFEQTVLCNTSSQFAKVFEPVIFRSETECPRWQVYCEDCLLARALFPECDTEWFSRLKSKDTFRCKDVAEDPELQNYFREWKEGSLEHTPLKCGVPREYVPLLPSNQYKCSVCSKWRALRTPPDEPFVCDHNKPLSGGDSAGFLDEWDVPTMALDEEDDTTLSAAPNFPFVPCASCNVFRLVYPFNEATKGKASCTRDIIWQIIGERNSNKANFTCSTIISKYSAESKEIKCGQFNGRPYDFRAEWNGACTVCNTNAIEQGCTNGACCIQHCLQSQWNCVLPTHEDLRSTDESKNMALGKKTHDSFNVWMMKVIDQYRMDNIEGTKRHFTFNNRETVLDMDQQNVDSSTYVTLSLMEKKWQEDLTIPGTDVGLLPFGQLPRPVFTIANASPGPTFQRYRVSVVHPFAHVQAGRIDFYDVPIPNNMSFHIAAYVQRFLEYVSHLLYYHSPGKAATTDFSSMWKLVPLEILPLYGTSKFAMNAPMVDLPKASEWFDWAVSQGMLGASCAIRVRLPLQEDPDTLVESQRLSADLRTNPLPFGLGEEIPMWQLVSNLVRLAFVSKDWSYYDPHHPNGSLTTHDRYFGSRSTPFPIGRAADVLVYSANAFVTKEVDPHRAYQAIHSLTLRNASGPHKAFELEVARNFRATCNDNAGFSVSNWVANAVHVKDETGFLPTASVVVYPCQVCQRFIYFHRRINSELEFVEGKPTEAFIYCAGRVCALSGKLSKAGSDFVRERYRSHQVVRPRQDEFVPFSILAAQAFDSPGHKLHVKNTNSFGLWVRKMHAADSSSAFGSNLRVKSLFVKLGNNVSAALFLDWLYVEIRMRVYAILIEDCYYSIRSPFVKSQLFAEFNQRNSDTGISEVATNLALWLRQGGESVQGAQDTLPQPRKRVLNEFAALKLGKLNSWNECPPDPSKTQEEINEAWITGLRKSVSELCEEIVALYVKISRLFSEMNPKEEQKEENKANRKELHTKTRSEFKGLNAFPSLLAYARKSGTPSACVPSKNPFCPRFKNDSPFTEFMKGMSVFSFHFLKQLMVYLSQARESEIVIQFNREAKMIDKVSSSSLNMKDKLAANFLRAYRGFSKRSTAEEKSLSPPVVFPSQAALYEKPIIVDSVETVAQSLLLLTAPLYADGFTKPLTSLATALKKNPIPSLGTVHILPSLCDVLATPSQQKVDINQALVSLEHSSRNNLAVNKSVGQLKKSLEQQQRLNHGVMRESEKKEVADVIALQLERWGEGDFDIPNGTPVASLSELLRKLPDPLQVTRDIYSATGSRAGLYSVEIVHEEHEHKRDVFDAMGSVKRGYTKIMNYSEDYGADVDTYETVRRQMRRPALLSRAIKVTTEALLRTRTANCFPDLMLDSPDKNTDLVSEGGLVPVSQVSFSGVEVEHVRKRLDMITQQWKNDVERRKESLSSKSKEEFKDILKNLATSPFSDKIHQCIHAKAFWPRVVYSFNEPSRDKLLLGETVDSKKMLYSRYREAEAEAKKQMRAYLPFLKLGETHYRGVVLDIMENAGYLSSLAYLCSSLENWHEDYEARDSLNEFDAKADVYGRIDTLDFMRTFGTANEMDVAFPMKTSEFFTDNYQFVDTHSKSQVAECYQQIGKWLLQQHTQMQTIGSPLKIATQTAFEKKQILQKAVVLVDALVRKIAYVIYPQPVKESPLQKALEEADFSFLVPLFGNIFVEIWNQSQSILSENSYISKIATPEYLKKFVDEFFSPEIPKTLKRKVVATSSVPSKKTKPTPGLSSQVQKGKQKQDQLQTEIHAPPLLEALFYPSEALCDQLNHACKCPLALEGFAEYSEKHSVDADPLTKRLWVSASLFAARLELARLSFKHKLEEQKNIPSFRAFDLKKDIVSYDDQTFPFQVEPLKTIKVTPELKSVREVLMILALQSLYGSERTADDRFEWLSHKRKHSQESVDETLKIKGFCSVKGEIIDRILAACEVIECEHLLRRKVMTLPYFATLQSKKHTQWLHSLRTDMRGSLEIMGTLCEMSCEQFFLYDYMRRLLQHSCLLNPQTSKTYQGFTGLRIGEHPTMSLEDLYSILQHVFQSAPDKKPHPEQLNALLYGFASSRQRKGYLFAWLNAYWMRAIPDGFSYIPPLPLSTDFSALVSRNQVDNIQALKSLSSHNVVTLKLVNNVSLVRAALTRVVVHEDLKSVVDAFVTFVSTENFRGGNASVALLNKSGFFGLNFYLMEKTSKTMSSKFMWLEYRSKRNVVLLRDADHYSIMLNQSGSMIFDTEDVEHLKNLTEADFGNLKTQRNQFENNSFFRCVCVVGGLPYERKVIERYITETASQLPYATNLPSDEVTMWIKAMSTEMNITTIARLRLSGHAKTRNLQ
jgi:hypothetical protein